MLLVVQSSFLSPGLKARNGVKSSQASSKTRTACGYFCPHGEAESSASLSRAASALGAV